MKKAQQDKSTEAPLSIDEEFFQHNLSTSKRLPYLGAFSFAVVGAFLYGAVDTRLIVLWLVLSSIFMFARAYYIQRDARNFQKPIELKARAIYISNVIVALLLASSLFFFPFATPVARAMQAVLILGITASHVATSGGDWRAYLPFIIINCVPLGLLWFIFPVEDDKWKSYGAGVLCFTFMYNLAEMGKETFNSFKSSVDMRRRYAEINKKLEKALNESELSSAAKTRFLATASHDLRQPVHTLSLLNAALRARKMDERTQEISESMGQSLQTLSNQLNALLDISKLDAGIIVPQKDVFDLSYSLRRIHEQYQSLALEKRLLIKLDCENNICVLTDGNLLDSIIQNLLSNAIKYTPEGRITLSLKTEDGRAHLCIEDSGVGIPEDKHELVFEEFYQVDNPHRDKMKGLGLGLSIVRRLTRLLDIDLFMHSQVGEGTRFHLYIPLSKIPGADKPVSSTDDFDFSHLRVLVVDDEEGVRLATRLYLEELGCSVMLAEGSEQARGMAEQNKPDLLLTDFRLKNNDSGLITIKHLRALYPDLPTIIMTGDTAPDRLKEAMEADAMLLHKPIEIEELKVAMRASFNRETVLA